MTERKENRPIMANTQKNNKNKQEEYGVNVFTKQLDRNLETAKERIELLNSILYTPDGYPVGFFEDLFDQDARLEALKDKDGNKDKGENKKKYINLFPTSTQPLSHDIYECKQLERMADYILTAEDQPRLDKQQEYNFYDEDGFKRLLRKERLYEDIIANMNTHVNKENELTTGDALDILQSNNQCTAKVHFSKKRIKRAKYINQETKMAFLKRIGENYKCDNKTKIYKKDLKDKDLKYVAELEEEIEKTKRGIKQGKFVNQRWLATSIIMSLKDAQVKYKDYKKGTIVFKNPLKDSGRVDYDVLDFFDKEHVLALINMPEKQITDDNDLSLVLYDLEVLMKDIKVREEDVDIVSLYRKGVSQEEIAKELNIAQQNVNQVLSKLADNVIQEYERVYEDWYYLNKVKGKYKKCSKCGEIKLNNKFGKDSRNSDGVKSICKKCDNLSKKL